MCGPTRGARPWLACVDACRQFKADKESAMKLLCQLRLKQEVGPRVGKAGRRLPKGSIQGRGKVDESPGRVGPGCLSSRLCVVTWR